MKIFLNILISVSCLLLMSCGGPQDTPDGDTLQPAPPAPVEAQIPQVVEVKEANESDEVEARYKVAPSWQYKDGTLSVALAYRVWPKEVEGFNISATDIATQKRYEMNTVPLIPQIQKGRDLSGFVLENPTLEQEAGAAFDRWFANEGGKETSFTPAEITKMNYQIKIGTYAMLDVEPLSLFGLGVRCAKELPAGKYELEVTANGTNKVFGKLVADTENPLPFPDLLTFDSITRKTSASLTYEFDEEPYRQKVAFYTLIGRHKSGGDDYKSEACMASIKVGRFVLTGSEENIIPSDYEFQFEACDWFGNRHLYTKENKKQPIRIKLASVDTGTNGVVDVKWRFPSGSVSDHLMVSIENDSGSRLSDPNVSEPFQSVGRVPANALSFAHRTNYQAATSVVYRVVLMDQKKQVSKSAIQTYQHPGTFVPLPGRILKVETNYVNGVNGYWIFPARSPYLEKSAYTISIQTTGRTKMIYPKYQNVKDVPIRLEQITRPGETYSIQIAEVSVIEGAGGREHFARSGNDSPPLRLTEPKFRQRSSSDLKK